MTAPTAAVVTLTLFLPVQPSTIEVVCLGGRADSLRGQVGTGRCVTPGSSLTLPLHGVLQRTKAVRDRGKSGGGLLQDYWRKSRPLSTCDVPILHRGRDRRSRSWSGSYSCFCTGYMYCINFVLDARLLLCCTWSLEDASTKGFRGVVLSPLPPGSVTCPAAGGTGTAVSWCSEARTVTASGTWMTCTGGASSSVLGPAVALAILSVDVGCCAFVRVVGMLGTLSPCWDVLEFTSEFEPTQFVRVLPQSQVN